MSKSAGIVISVSTELVTLECSNCGTLFAITDEFMRRRRNDHATFYCPRGHTQYYPAETQEEKLRKQVASLEGNLNWWRERVKREEEANVNLGHQLRAQKAAKTRILNRVQHGVCPHCNRTFANVARHMETKHAGSAEQ